MKKIILSLGMLGICFLCAAGAWAGAPVSVAVTVDTKNPGPAISPDYSGLSYEMSKVLPGRGGKYYFSPDNTALLATFKSLGVHHLRVGGNTGDRETVKIPSNADIDSLFKFARAAGVKVIYSLRMKTIDAAHATAIAKYIMEHYADDVDCFALGNEPNMYFKTFEEYRAKADDYLTTISAQLPGAKFCGASATPGKKTWAADFAKAYAKDPRIAYVTQHAYFGGNALKVKDSAAARDLLLDADLPTSYTKFFKSIVPTIKKAGFAYRFEETNNFFNSGTRSVSDTFASGLWALDYMHWWAADGGAKGLDFHMNPIYGAFVDSTAGQAVRPLGYAMKAFELCGQGRMAKVAIAKQDNPPNLTAYGVIGEGGEVCVTLINKEHGTGARDAAVTIGAGSDAKNGEVVVLKVEGGDVAANSGVTLGGAAIGDDGSWNGKWTALGEPKDGKFEVTVPAASAAVVRINFSSH